MKSPVKIEINNSNKEEITLWKKSAILMGIYCMFVYSFGFIVRVLW